MKPILFNTEMVRAILDGRKTTTRRIIKGVLESYTELQGIVTSTTGDDKLIGSYMFGLGCQCVYKNPPYQIGDILYVRETFGNWNYENPESLATYYQYRADYLDGAKTYEWPELDEFGERIICDLPKWHPSLHMPKEAARIFLKVTGVRAERLQEINSQGNHDGVLKEGYPFSYKTGSPISDFMFLWNSTIKKSDLDRYGWNANPFVWVIEFERCEKESENHA